MVQRLVLLPFALACLAAAAPLPAEAAGNQYRCEKVDRMARLGTPPGAAVTKEWGDDDPEAGGPYCAFSVDGYSVFGSPPFEQVAAALKLLQSPDLSRVHEGELVEALGWALIAAGKDKGFSDALYGLLKSAAPRIAGCLAAFRQGELKPGQRITFEGGSCAARGVGRHDDADFAVLMLEIRAVADNRTRHLFLPPSR